MIELGLSVECVASLETKRQVSELGYLISTAQTPCDSTAGTRLVKQLPNRINQSLPRFSTRSLNQPPFSGKSHLTTSHSSPLLSYLSLFLSLFRSAFIGSIEYAAPPQQPAHTITSSLHPPRASGSSALRRIGVSGGEGQNGRRAESEGVFRGR